MKKLLFVFVLFCTPSLFAQVCANGNCTAATCATADVQAALNSASLGDPGTVFVKGPCTATYTTALTGVAKNVTLLCVPAGSCDITVNMTGFGNDFYFQSGCQNGKGFRLSGWKLESQAQGDAMIFIQGGCAIGQGMDIRIDHNQLVPAPTPSHGRALWIEMSGTGRCLVDHNIINDVGTIVKGLTPGESFNGDSQFAINEVRPHPTISGAGAACFFEFNTPNITVPQAATLSNPSFGSGGQVDFDTSESGRTVWRYNTVKSDVIGGHGYDSVDNSGAEVDAYFNAIDGQSVASWNYQDRGMTGVVFENQMINSTSGAFTLTNFRDATNGASETHTNPKCFGSTAPGPNAVDQNLAPDATNHGWRCKEQPGRGTSATLSYGSDWPAYQWENCSSGPGQCSGNNAVSISVLSPGGVTDFTTSHEVANRDFYNGQTANCAGTQTTGVCVGLLANRAANCTTDGEAAGVGFFATDTLTLYTCDAANTWTSRWVQPVAPHPLDNIPMPVGVM